MPNVPKWMADIMVSALRSKMPSFRVADVCNISPNIKSILLEGNLDNLNFEPGYAIAIRVSPTAFRHYTPSFVDYKEGVFQVLAHIHGNGPGAAYLDTLQPGATLQIANPTGKRVYHPDVDHYVFFGDETALGLATMLQYHFREHRNNFHFLLELENQHFQLPKDLGLSNYDILNKGKLMEPDDITGIPALTHKNQSPWSTARYILAGNARSIQRMRKQLKHQKVPSRQIITQAYWAHGKSGL